MTTPFAITRRLLNECGPFAVTVQLLTTIFCPSYAVFPVAIRVLVVMTTVSADASTPVPEVLTVLLPPVASLLIVTVPP